MKQSDHTGNMLRLTKYLFFWLMLAAYIPVSAEDKKADTEETAVLYYPALPDAPRIQYLTRFSTAADVREKKKSRGGWLAKFVLGEEDPEDMVGPVKPYGVALYKGLIHVVDTRGGGYAIFDLPAKDYRFVYGSGAAVMSKPINITLDNDGNKYISDTQRDQVLKFDQNDKYLMAYGAKGQFQPTDVAIVDDRLYVVDIKGHQINVLDNKTGQEIFTFGGVGAEEGKLFQPTNIALGPDNHLYVSDTGNFRVQKFTLEGKYVRSFGAGVGTGVGNFARPKGIALDREGRLYVVDSAFENVQIFDKEGQLLLFFGEQTGTHPAGLDLPTTIDIDYDSVADFQKYADPAFKLEYVILVANQFGPSKVVVFGFGRHEGMSYPEEE